MAKRPESAVTEVRERIAALKAERRDIQAQPATPTEAEASVDRYIAYHADQYRQRSTVERLKQRATFEGLGDKDDAFFCFFFAEAIKSALMSETDDGMAATDRTAAIQRLDEELLAAEYAEEKLITEAEQRGHFITRRASADPRAVLDFD